MSNQERLNKVFRQVFDDETIEINPEMTADDVEGWDSFSHVNLIIAVELEFGIEFKQKEVLSFANVGELLDCIGKKLAGNR